MSFDNDRPALAERYARALASTDLALSPERCSVDYLIAAGWCKDGLGVKLYRTRAEFDAVRAEQRQAEHNLIAALADAKREKPEARAYLQQSAEDAALTARALVLIHLRSLAETRQALGEFTAWFATRQRFMQPDQVAMTIAGRVLDQWLDPLCGHCEGRGFSGGAGAAVVLCTQCHGSGKRSAQFAPDPAGHDFGRDLMAELNHKCDQVSGQMRRFLAGGRV